jgi:hypothetical protein
MDPTSAGDPFTAAMASSSVQFDSSPSARFDPGESQNGRAYDVTEQSGLRAQGSGASGQDNEGSVAQQQRPRNPQSQYYIVFSVTGIERSNAKNPIIRFDAKVRKPKFPIQGTIADVG